jgi:hypothetical protein
METDMKFEDRLLKEDRDAVETFIKSLADAGVPAKKLQPVKDYCELSFIWREDQGPVSEAGEIKQTEGKLLEAARKKSAPELVEKADAFLVDQVWRMYRHLTVNFRLDPWVKQPQLMEDALDLTPPSILQHEWAPAFVMAFWNECKLNPHSIGKGLRNLH